MEMELAAERVQHTEARSMERLQTLRAKRDELEAAVTAEMVRQAQAARRWEEEMEVEEAKVRKQEEAVIAVMDEQKGVVEDEKLQEVERVDGEMAPMFLEVETRRRALQARQEETSHKHLTMDDKLSAMRADTIEVRRVREELASKLLQREGELVQHEETLALKVRSSR